MGKGIGQVSAGLSTLGTRAAIGAAAGLAAVVTTAASFEQAFTGVEKTVDGTDAQLAELEQTLRSMARTIPVSFEELSAIGEAGGALGVARDSLDEFIDVVARLSVSTNLSSDAAATALGQLGTILHLTEGDYEDFADSLVALGNAGASTETQIVELAARFAAAGNSAGLSKEEILALSSATASMGIEVEAGGTALSMTFNGITQAIGTGSDEIKAYTKTLGISAAEFKKRWTEDALGTFQDFLGELAKLDKYQQADILQEAGITGQRQLNAIMAMTQNVGFLGDQLDVARNAQGALDKESQKFFDTSAGQWKTLVGNVRDAAATIGAELLPVANSLIHDFVEKLQQPGTQAALKTFGADLASGVKGLVRELKGTDFSGIIGGMKIAAGVAKSAFDAFRSLPEPIQQLAIAAIVANKVSGGAIGQIARGMADIFRGAFKTINAVNVTVIGKNVIGPGGGIGAPTTGGAGLTIVKFLGLASAAAMGAVIGNWIGKEVFFNPTVNPAVEREKRLLEEATGDRAKLQAGLDTINKSILQYQLSPLMMQLSPEQYALLVEQKAAIEKQLAELGSINANTKAPILGPPVPAGLQAQQRILQALETLPFGLGEQFKEFVAKPLSDAELIRLLAKTSEFGKAGVGTSIEHGPLTGKDPYGEEALALFRRAEFPRMGETLGEIERHIIAAEEVQRTYLEEGDINSATRTQAVIDGMHALLGTVDKTLPLLEQAKQNSSLTATQTANIARMTPATIETGRSTAEQTRQTALNTANAARLTGSTIEPLRLTALQSANAARMTERTLEPLWVSARKNPSFTANITTNVNARLSVTQSLYTQTLYNSIKGDNLLDRL